VISTRRAIRTARGRVTVSLADALGFEIKTWTSRNHVALLALQFLDKAAQSRKLSLSLARFWLHCRRNGTLIAASGPGVSLFLTFTGCRFPPAQPSRPAFGLRLQPAFVAIHWTITADSPAVPSSGFASRPIPACAFTRPPGLAFGLVGGLHRR